MANKEHLTRLKQGRESWNRWRERHPELRPDLSGAYLGGVDLSDADLTGADLSRADLAGAHFSGADLTGADLSDAYLTGAHFSGADLSRANLSRADLTGAYLTSTYLSDADLTGAKLSRADLTGANLFGANLSGTDLTRAYLRIAYLIKADLTGAIFKETVIGWTTFGDVDLRTVQGLESVKHEGPLTIGTDTLVRSEGNIPEIFLRRAGLPDTFIIYARSLIANPIQYYTCFISYSSRDQDFAERLHADLQARGVRCWFAPEDLKIGDKFWHRIDESIRLYDKLVVILSEHSVQSEWVEREVMAALEKEQQRGQLVLFPLTLDDAVMHATLPWAATIRRTRHIGNFMTWKQHDDYQKALTRLLRDLKAEAPHTHQNPSSA